MPEERSGHPSPGDDAILSTRATWRAFGKYQTFASLGQGGMADVFLAIARGPKGFNKLVVVKTLRQELVQTREFVDMFLEEARLAARLNHPNVVHTHEVGEVDGTFFLAMEFLEGQSFSHIIEHLRSSGESMRPAVVARLVSDALAGLHYAHELSDYDGRPLRIVHRDISPQNLVVTYEGQVKVVDFGIAKATSSVIETEVGVMKGKVAYMAPEQAIGDVLDRRADIYAMGLVLWEAFTLRRITEGESASARLARLLGNEVPLVSSVVPGFDPRLDAVVTRALHRDPEGRFQTAEEMRDALEGWINQTGAVVRQEEIGRRLREMFKEVRSEVGRRVQAQMAEVGPASSSGPPQEVTAAPPAPLALPSPSLAPTQRERRGSRPRWLLGASRVALALVSLGALVVAGAWWSRRSATRLAERERPARAEAATPPPSGRPITDWPPPEASSQEAVNAYMDALHAIRDGDISAAMKSLKSAVAIDPRLGAAQLRIALLEGAGSELGRASLERAAALRDRLSARDRAMLRAAQTVRDGAQRDGADSLVAALPADPEALVWSAGWYWSLDLDASRRALELYAEAAGLDPRFALAFGRIAHALVTGSGWSCATPKEERLCEGHPDQAITTAELCLAVVPGSPACLVARALGHALLGQCAALEEDAKSLVVSTPSAPEGYAYLMTALMSRGAPAPALEELAERHRAAFPEPDRPRVALRDRVRLAIYTGDFAAAERALGDLEATAAGSNAEQNHFASFTRLMVLEEEGARSRALAEADEYFHKMAAWSLDYGRIYARVYVIAELVRAGRLSKDAAAAELDAWQTASAERYPTWRETHRWVMRSAAVETEAEAREAMSRAPANLLPYNVGLTYFRGTLGRILALGGQGDLGIPYLQDETTWCGPQYGYDGPFDSFHALRQTQDRLVLGQALEAKGDRAGACAEYARIEVRWGHAKPRSVTADRARERAKALACAR
jgi:serine/threonine protein kinase